MKYTDESGRGVKMETRDEYKKSGQSMIMYDRMLWNKYIIDNISEEFLRKNTITNSVGEKHIWAKTRNEIEAEKKQAVKNAKKARALYNKNTVYGVKWADKSMDKTNKKNIEFIVKRYETILNEAHLDNIKIAIEEGLPVPAEVLADYPAFGKNAIT